MELSRKGALFIIESEGIVLVPYKDSAGVWTIGVGHTAAAGAPNPHFHRAITIGEALALFERDVGKYATQVARAIPGKLAQHEFDALVSFHFNTGAIARAQLTKELKAGRRKSAAKAFLAWTKVTINGKKVTSTGLLARRLLERKLFETGDYSEPFIASVWSRWPGKGRPTEL